MTQIKGNYQYKDFIERAYKNERPFLGPMTGWGWYDDPRRLAFMLSRYKFVAKMFEKCGNVLEIGCGDGFGTRIVAQVVDSVTAIDIEPAFIASAKKQKNDPFKIYFKEHDIIAASVEKIFDAVYSLDVLEHIAEEKEDRFLANLTASLSRDGSCIIGMPSMESQIYASTYSRMGHVNCKEQPVLKSLMKRYFRNVFMFSMNDEIVHTGYSKMSHYNIALCCGKNNS